MSSGQGATPMFRYRGRIADLTAGNRAALMMRVKETDARVRDTTARIIADVRDRGDSALIEMARQFDGVDLTAIEVPRAAIDSALASIDPKLRSALERAARNIEAVHRASLPVNVEVEPEPGVIVGRRPDPLRIVGGYAPGGRAAYASSVLMCAIPARVAGVAEVVICSPPGKDGLPSPIVLAACAIAKVDRVFAVGGAGAIAAMTYGTASIPRVDKIVGPGNAYVAEAKVQVSRIVGIDSPAGPSELMVICDDSCDGAVIAAEVLAQAEHDPDACVIVVALTPAVVERITAAIEDDISALTRAQIARESLAANGGILVAGEIDEAIAFASEYAPEHLLIAVKNPGAMAKKIRNAGCVFIGEESSVVFGDYISGGNHVLPTAGTARSYSGLGTLDFIRWTGYQRVTRAAAESLSADAAILAEAEGLGGHSAAAAQWKAQ